MSKSNICCNALNSFLSPRLFKALGDPNRVALLARLAEVDGEATVSRIAETLPIDLSVVSRHLAILREAGVLESERRGKEVFYRVRINELTALLRNLADALEACCPDGVCPSKGEER